MKLMIIGGSNAGICAALRARELDRNLEVTVLLVSFKMIAPNSYSVFHFGVPALGQSAMCGIRISSCE